MKLISIWVVVVGVFFCIGADAQISFKTEYIGNSAYMYAPLGDKSSVRVGNSSGSAIVYQGSVNIPLYMKVNANGRPTVWGMGLGGAYASLSNNHFTNDLISKIMNLQLGIFHLRPLNDKWSMMASIGVGVYTPFTKLSNIRFKNLLGSIGVIFVRHLTLNLDLGVGLAMNSTFGYPMIFPALYLKWNYESKIKVNVSLGEGLELSAGYDINKYFSLSFAGEMNGQMALLEKDGKDVMFSHQYIVTGFRPEIKFGSTGITMPIMIGINAVRPTYYSDRTLKGMFAMDNDYYFSISPYVSVGMKYGF